MARPSLERGPSAIFSLRAPRALVARVDTYCKRLGITRSEFVRQALEEYADFLDDYVDALKP
jgi:predicted DNA-binding protein